MYIGTVKCDECGGENLEVSRAEGFEDENEENYIVEVGFYEAYCYTCGANFEISVTLDSLLTEE